MKKVLTLLLLASCATNVKAYTIKNNNDNVELELKGLFHFQGGYVAQSHRKGDDRNVSNGKSKLALFTEAAISLEAAHILDDFTYGAKIVAVPTTKLAGGTSVNGSNIYIKSDFGKVELGAPTDAGSKLRVAGTDPAAGSGDFGYYASKKINYLKYNKVETEFAGYSFFYRSYKTSLKKLNDDAETSRLISYFTPKIMDKFQLGISYIPDSSNTGGAGVSDLSSGIKDVTLADGTVYNFNKNVKDGFSGGVSYEENLGDGIDLQLALTGECGKSSGKIKVINKDKQTITEYKLSNLGSYNIGGTLNYGSFVYGLSYGSLGKSLTTPQYNKTGRNTDFYSGAIAYSQGPYKVSTAYTRITQFKNTTDNLTFAGEYKIIPGISTYSELTLFKYKGKPTYFPEAPIKQTKGVAIVGGMKFKV